MCRHELYTDYKAQRPPMPDAMKLAIPKIQQLLQVSPGACPELDNSILILRESQVATARRAAVDAAYRCCIVYSIVPFLSACLA